MREPADTLWCTNCGVEIQWGPYLIEGKPYCCQACFQGRPCGCGERMEMDEERRSGQEFVPAHAGYSQLAVA